MPTIDSANIPPSTGWDEFEDITMSASKLRWRSSDFFRHGRQGQSQQGVDIWGHDGEGRHIGVQCKNTINGLNEATIKKEIANAEAFKPPIDALYIATTAKRDAIIQKSVRDISTARREAGKFTVNILFWEDVRQDLAADADTFFKHYPQFRERTDAAKEHDKELFERLTKLLSSDGVIGFIDQANMAGFPFPTAAIEPLWEFHKGWNCPEREFLSPEIESVKKALWKAVEAYGVLMCSETFPTRTPGWNAVPSEWELEQPERFNRVVNKLHTLAGEIVRLHAELVRTGRSHLIKS